MTPPYERCVNLQFVCLLRKPICLFFENGGNILGFRRGGLPWKQTASYFGPVYCHCRRRPWYSLLHCIDTDILPSFGRNVNRKHSVPKPVPTPGSRRKHTKSAGDGQTAFVQNAGILPVYFMYFVTFGMKENMVCYPWRGYTPSSLFPFVQKRTGADRKSRISAFFAVPTLIIRSCDQCTFRKNAALPCCWPVARAADSTS